ncbi:MAG: hypothetical protein P4K98_06320 [Bryobacteraceae bacterium]|nr:hypothetical protein [Bryobacteraceae bacterium]
MKTFARVDSNVVEEIYATDSDISSLFHPSLRWIDITGQTVSVGWEMSASGQFSPPVQATATPSAMLSLSDLQAEITALKAQLATIKTS